MSTDRAERRRQQVEFFRQVASERITKLNLAWIEFEQSTGDPAHFLREIHTLKGEASLMGFASVSQVIHTLESFVKALRDAKIAPLEIDGDLVLQGLDLAQQGTRSVEDDALAGLDAYLQAIADRRSSIIDGEAPGAGQATSEVSRALPLPQELRGQSPRPSSSPTTSTQWPILGDEDGTGSIRQSRLVRVTAEKIDRLRDMVSDLLLSSVRWRQLTKEVRQLREIASLHASRPQGKAGATPVLVSIAASLANMESRVRDETHDIERLITEIDGTTRDLRMIPLAALFERFPMLLRQVARQVGRQVRFEAVGDRIEVDKALLELLEEPLLHLLRNAVDHGAESPEIRTQLGKPAEALVRIEARMMGQRLHLSLFDDGAGIDLESVRKRAVEAGVLDGMFAEAATDDQILRTIFAPGFSTRDQASEISGRGFGLNIVLDVIENIGGRISVETTLGKGTTFHLDVPLTVVITRVVLFRVGLGAYALPVGSVATLVEANSEDLIESKEGMFFRLQGAFIPLLDLHAAMGGSKSRPTGSRLIVAQNGGEWVALSGTYGHLEREVVLKPLGRFYERHPLVSAAVVLEEGDHALVLKGAELVRISRSRAARPIPVMDRDDAVMEGRIAIVADDSPIVRDIIAQSLRSHGLHVLLATNGEEALALFNTQARVDLVVTDIDMPKIDGLALVRSLRARQAGQAIPVVALSMRASALEKQAAMEAGMSAYLDKSDFNQAVLWQTIQPFVVGE